MDVHEQMIAESEALVKRIRPILAGNPPGMQGLVIVQLVGIWLAGHAPHLRDELSEGLMDSAKAIAPNYERQVFGNAGHPGEAQR